LKVFSKYFKELVPYKVKVSLRSNKGNALQKGLETIVRDLYYFLNWFKIIFSI
jgi:hypothetical protein